MEMDHPRFLPISHQAKEKRVVKKSAVFLCAALFAAFLTLSAAPPDQNWSTDYKKAQAEAKAKKLPMLVVFTRGGNARCGEFDSKVLNSEKFKSFTKGKFVFAYLDCPEKPAAEDAAAKDRLSVAEQHQVNTFPTVVLANADGKTLGKLNESNEKEFLTKLAKIYGNTNKDVAKKNSDKKKSSDKKKDSEKNKDSK